MLCLSGLSTRLPFPATLRLQVLISSFSSASAEMEKVEQVEIDDQGRFKYIMIKLYNKVGETPLPRLCVRGFKWAEYHADIYDRFMSELDSSLDSECVGGGRIEHDKSAKTLKVYGFSQGYGRADHAVTADLLKTKYPNYDITWTNDGY